jgi:hypothetical protein
MWSRTLNNMLKKTAKRAIASLLLCFVLDSCVTYHTDYGQEWLPMVATILTVASIAAVAVVAMQTELFQ